VLSCVGVGWFYQQPNSVEETIDGSYQELQELQRDIFSKWRWRITLPGMKHGQGKSPQKGHWTEKIIYHVWLLDAIRRIVWPTTSWNLVSPANQILPFFYDHGQSLEHHSYYRNINLLGSASLPEARVGPPRAPSCDCWYTRSHPAFSSINLSYLEICWPSYCKQEAQFVSAFLSFRFMKHTSDFGSPFLVISQAPSMNQWISEGVAIRPRSCWVHMAVHAKPSADPSADPRICYARVFESKNRCVRDISEKHYPQKTTSASVICMTHAPGKIHDKSWLRNLTTHYRSAQSGFHGFSLITNRYVGCKYIRSERKLINQQRRIRFMIIIWLYTWKTVSP